MEITLVTGGVRSGKSRWAQDEALRLSGQAVTVIATAEAVDEEMRDRIDAHRVHRPEGWTTIEASRDVGAALGEAEHDTVLLDCMTVLAGMALGRTRPETEQQALDAMEAEVTDLLEAAERRPGRLIVVTNEVGWSVHPPTALGRWYQDGMGAANRRLAERADTVVLMVSGLEMRLK